MKKNCIIALCVAALLSGCARDFNNVYKSNDNTYKYEYAKQCFAQGRFQQAATLLQELVTMQKGRESAQESLYMLGMAQFCNRDYEAASATFKKYFQSYPKGDYAEQASFYTGQSLFQSMPDPVWTSRPPSELSMRSRTSWTTIPTRRCARKPRTSCSSSRITSS